MTDYTAALYRGILFLACVVFWLSVALFASAWAHSWYDPFCCNGNDCAPAADDRISEGPDGYRVRLEDRSVLVPHGDSRIKPSGDNEFHVCELPKGTVRCLYVPPRGV